MEQRETSTESDRQFVPQARAICVSVCAHNLCTDTKEKMHGHEFRGLGTSPPCSHVIINQSNGCILSSHGGEPRRFSRTCSRLSSVRFLCSCFNCVHDVAGIFRPFSILGSDHMRHATALPVIKRRQTLSPGPSASMPLRVPRVVVRTPVRTNDGFVPPIMDLELASLQTSPAHFVQHISPEIVALISGAIGGDLQTITNQTLIYAFTALN